MKLAEFKEISTELWNKYLASIAQSFSRSLIAFDDNQHYLGFPSIALFTETDQHFILELFGAKQDFRQLTIKNHKTSSTLQYINLFKYDQESQGGINLLENNMVLQGLKFTNGINEAEIDKRFPYVRQWTASLRMTGTPVGNYFKFGPEFGSCYWDNCIMMSRFGAINRIKDILHMTIVSKSFSSRLYREELAARMNEAWTTWNEFLGVYTLSGHLDESFAIASQFANMFLLPNLRETSLGEFAKSHPSLIQRALGYKHFLYEPDFDWLEGNPDNTEHTINPDLMLERTDGLYDICDLKTARSERTSLTKGGHRRRRFIDYVQEGISQLANYQEYFQFEKNREHAWSRHRVKVVNPKLILIVGNYENASIEELREASRTIPAHYTVIDYDSLNALFVRSFTSPEPPETAA